LFAFAIALLLAPEGRSPGEKAARAAQEPVPVSTTNPAPELKDSTQATITDAGASSGDPSAPATPQPIRGLDAVTASGSTPKAPRPIASPGIDFETAPGVLSTSFRTRRKEALKAYPTEALGAIALGLEDLRLTPSNRAGQLEVNLGDQIRYEQKDHEVPKRSRRLLDGIGRLLAENPDTRIQILSHTDDEGDAGFNLRLSQRRADAVKEYLVGRGVAQERVSAQGRGEEAPLVVTGKRNPTRAERAQNRRTELVIEALEPAEQGSAEDEIPETDAASTPTTVTRVEGD
jgi:outer membrane protein OmpA-like peptidoglycan-associated protein